MKRIFWLFLIVLLCSCSNQQIVDNQEPNSSDDNQTSTKEDINENNTHDHVYELVETISPTCTEVGKKEYVCEICGKTQAPSEVPAKGHSYEEVYTKFSTCNEEGNIAEQCSVCGYVKSNTTTPAMGHHINAEYYVDETKIVIEFYCYSSNCKYHKEKIGGITYDTGVKLTQDLYTHKGTSIHTGPNGQQIVNEISDLPKWLVIDGEVIIGTDSKFMVAIIYTTIEGMGYDDLPIDYQTRRDYWLNGTYQSNYSELVIEYKCELNGDKIILTKISN